MMKLIPLFALVLNFSSTGVYASTDKTDAAVDPKKQEMMKKWMEYSTPGEAHKVLAGIAGKWSYTSKWWETEESKPEETKGTVTMKMILGGRFLQQELKGKSMGMPFEGFGLIGYDNLKKKYETTWVDNMGTGSMRGTGTFDTSTKTLKESGEFMCPMTGDKAEFRGEWKIIDKNNMAYAMYGKGMDGEGKEFKMMETTYKRK